MSNKRLDNGVSPVPYSHSTGAMTADDLPDFAYPPVDEVVLSLQFAPVHAFGIPHFGLFWQRVRADYPRFEVRPAINEQTDQFPSQQVQLSVEWATHPDVRCLFMDDSGSHLIQVQPSRFLQNWRRLTGEEVYPRYPVLRKQFAMEWERFNRFLADEKLERPRVNQCEVLYVNHIEYGKGWNGYGDLDKVVEVLATPKKTSPFLPAPERIGMQVAYPIDGKAGRLFVTFTPVIRGRDGKEVLQMSLAARGAPRSDAASDVLEWLDLGRKWVVNGFRDFTTENMQKIWGKR